MRPLPRLHAVTDASVLALEDFGVRAAAIAAVGPGVALHARDRTAGGARMADVVSRMLSLARPPEASVFVNGRPDLASALRTQGVQLGTTDLSPRDARLVLGSEWSGWIGASVHDLAEAERAAQEGADFLMAGPLYETASHPGRPAAGLWLIAQSGKFGLPVIAIGGITPERAVEARKAGAYGVAVIRAAWYAQDPAVAALALLEPWAGECK